MNARPGRCMTRALMACCCVLASGCISTNNNRPAQQTQQYNVALEDRVRGLWAERRGDPEELLVIAYLPDNIAPAWYITYDTHAATTYGARLWIDESEPDSKKGFYPQTTVTIGSASKLAIDVDGLTGNQSPAAARGSYESSILPREGVERHPFKMYGVGDETVLLELDEPQYIRLRFHSVKKLRPNLVNTEEGYATVIVDGQPVMTPTGQPARYYVPLATDFRVIGSNSVDVYGSKIELRFNVPNGSPPITYAISGDYQIMPLINEGD